jgi:hypothetical protein
VIQLGTLSSGRRAVPPTPQAPLVHMASSSHTSLSVYVGMVQTLQIANIYWALWPHKLIRGRHQNPPLVRPRRPDARFRATRRDRKAKDS